MRWLNDREDRMLQKSLNLMEKAHKVTLSRLQHEVQGLQDTLRGQATVRNPQLSKKMHAPEKENSGAKRTTTSIHTVDVRRLRSEDLSPASKFGDEIPNSTVEEFEDVENILFEDDSNPSQNILKSLEVNSSHKHAAWTTKVSSDLKRPITKQLSSSSEHLSSSPSSLSGSRRKISVTDPPPTGKLSVSPGLRKTPSLNSLQLNTNPTSNRSKELSGETPIQASTNPSISVTLNSSSQPVRKVSPKPMRKHQGSPLFVRRKLSPGNSTGKLTSPRLVRKISCPPQIEHLPIVHKDTRASQPSRDNNGPTALSVDNIPTELPKLRISRGIELGVSFNGNVSPVDPNEDVMDCTLHERVNIFLRSLEKNDETQENER